MINIQAVVLLYLKLCGTVHNKTCSWPDSVRMLPSLESWNFLHLIEICKVLYGHVIEKSLYNKCCIYVRSLREVRKTSDKNIDLLKN